LVVLGTCRHSKAIAKAFNAGFHLMAKVPCPGRRVPGDEVEAFVGGLLGGEVAAGPDCAAVAGVD
jgi:hypothetical protein